MIIGDYYFKTTYFMKEILFLLDKNNTESISDIEKQFDKHNIVQYVFSKYGFKNVYITKDDIPAVQGFLDGIDICVSEEDAHKRGIINNGLVYLVYIITERFSKEYTELARIQYK